jgi:hypothetical protein
MEKLSQSFFKSLEKAKKTGERYLGKTRMNMVAAYIPNNP